MLHACLVISAVSDFATPWTIACQGIHIPGIVHGISGKNTAVCCHFMENKHLHIAKFIKKFDVHNICTYLNFRKIFFVHKVTKMTNTWSVHVQFQTTYKEDIFKSWKYQRCADLISNKFPSKNIFKYVMVKGNILGNPPGKHVLEKWLTIHSSILAWRIS